MQKLWILFLLFSVSALSQPAPILRNSWSTNAAGTPVRGQDNLSVTNLGSGTNWQFYNVGPKTIARLSDVTNIASSFAAGSAIDSVQTNTAFVVGIAATNLNFVEGTNILFRATNADGNVSIQINSTISGSGGAGETNFNGEISVTNASRIGWVAGKSGVTNLLRSAQGGNGVLLTNQGTNVMFAIDPSVVASQTDLNSASNTLRSLVGETNFNGEVSVTNATRVGLVAGKSNNTNLLRSVQGGNGIVLTNQGTNVMFAIDPAVVASQANLTAASNALVSLAGETNFNGEVSITNAGRFGLVNGKINVTNLLRSIEPKNGLVGTNEGGTNISLAINPAIVASQANLTAASNAIVALVGETNFNGEISVTNATRMGWVAGKSNNTNLLRSIQGGNGVVLTNQGTNVMVAIDPSVVPPGLTTNANQFLGTPLSIKDGARVTNLFFGNGTTEGFVFNYDPFLGDFVITNAFTGNPVMFLETSDNVMIDSSLQVSGLTITERMEPIIDNNYDIGTASLRYQDLFLSSSIFTAGRVQAHQATITNDFALAGFNSTSNDVWTCTNTVTGQGEWRPKDTMPTMDGNFTNVNTWASAADRVSLTVNGFIGSGTNRFQVVTTNGQPVAGVSSNGVLFGSNVTANATLTAAGDRIDFSEPRGFIYDPGLNTIYVNYTSGAVTNSSMHVFTGGGAVGIRTNIPEQALHVRGDVLIDGNLRIPFGAVSNEVWTCTNSTTGEGEWRPKLNGTTNYMQLWPTRAKLASTNSAYPDNTLQTGFMGYAKTNGVGANVSISSTHDQLFMPNDYATNTLRLTIGTMITATNGPNNSNVVWQATILRHNTVDGVSTNDAQIGPFDAGSSTLTVTWAASFSGTNKVQVSSTIISNCTVAAGEPFSMKLERLSGDSGDGYTGVSGVISARLEYTR